MDEPLNMYKFDCRVCKNPCRFQRAWESDGLYFCGRRNNKKGYYKCAVCGAFVAEEHSRPTPHGERVCEDCGGED